MQRAGIHTDGVGTTELAGSLRVDRQLNPQLVLALNSGVEFAYKTFVKIVADGRKMTPAAVDPIAQGRVWCAQDALQSGLIDKVGTLADAVAAAGKLAKVENYKVEYVEPTLSTRDMLLKQLMDNVGSLHLWPASTSTALVQLLAPMREAAQELNIFQDPGHLYVRCMACGLVR
jgi:protease-4